MNEKNILDPKEGRKDEQMSRDKKSQNGRLNVKQSIVTLNVI
jgi:hypothetical protein